MSSQKTKIDYEDTDYGHQARMQTTKGHIQDMAREITEACEDIFKEGITKTEYIAAHAYHFGTILGAAGVVIDLGNPEEYSIMHLVKTGYIDIKNWRAN